MTSPYIATRSHPLRSPSAAKSRITPRGWTWIAATVLCAAFWGGVAEQAWANLLRDAAHMPYRGIEDFKARGYKVEFWSPQ